MCDDLFVGKISLNITKNISVNIWEEYPDFYHNLLAIIWAPQLGSTEKALAMGYFLDNLHKCSRF